LKLREIVGEHLDEWSVGHAMENLSPYAVMRLLADNPGSHALPVNWQFNGLGSSVRKGTTAGHIRDRSHVRLVEGLTEAAREHVRAGGRAVRWALLIDRRRALPAMRARLGLRRKRARAAER
jgi:hypothetical protein